MTHIANDAIRDNDTWHGLIRFITRVAQVNDIHNFPQL